MPVPVRELVVRSAPENHDVVSYARERNVARMTRVDFDDELYKTYGKGRKLAPDVIQMWMRAVTSFVAPADVDRVIDLGAGTGRFSSALAEALQADVIAVDPSRNMLRSVGPAAQRVVAQAESLPLPGSRFDLVFASMVMHHFADLKVAASEIERILRPGGALVVRTCFAETLDTPYHRFFPSVLDIERRLLPTTSEIVGALEFNGLGLTQETRLRQRMDVSHAAYAERIRQRAMSPLRLISDEEFAAGMAALDEVARAEVQPEAVFEDIDLLHFTKGAT